MSRVRPARLIVAQHPFDLRGRAEFEVEAGRALRELVPQVCAPGWAVHVNGRPVPFELLPALELRPGDLVTARAVPGDPVTIGFIVSTLVTSALSGVSLAAVSAGTSAFIVTLVGAAAGYLAMRAFTPDVSRQASAPASQPFFSVAGSRNQLRPFGSLPQHYGRLRVVPDLAAPHITSVSADAVQTVRALFAVGVGRYSGISASGESIKIGNQPVSTLGVKDFEVYSGLEDSQTPSDRLARFAQNTIEEPLGLELRHLANTGSAEHIRTTAEDALGFDVQLVFPGGLWRISDSGRQQNLTLKVRVRYREVGTTPWTVLVEEIITGWIAQRFTRNYHGDPPGAAQYEVSVQILPNMSAGLYTKDRGGSGGSTAMTGDALWLSLRSYLLGESINDAATQDVTLFGLALEASDLVSGTLDQVSVDAQRMLPTWSAGTGWSDVALGERNPAAYTATSNPAWAFAHELREAGIPDAEIDAPQIAAWASFCDLKGWRCNWQQTDEMTLIETLQLLASAGQATYAPRGSLFSVVYDTVREPVAAFGPLNSRDFSSVQLPIERIDAIRARFVNTTQIDGRLDERVIYFDGHTAATAEVYRTADVLNGLTDPVLVERFIRLGRLKTERRTILYQWRADLSSVVVEAGDVVLLQNVGDLRGSGETMATGYSTRDAGAHMDELFCEPAVRIEAGRDYTLRVRTRARGTSGGYRILTLAIANPLTAGVQMLSALPIAGNVAPPTYEDDSAVTQVDDLVEQPAFMGEAEAGLVIVTEVRFDAPGSCMLSGVEFAPEIFDVPLAQTPHDPRSDPQLIANTAPAAPVLGGDPFRRLRSSTGGGTFSPGYAGGYAYPSADFVVPLAPPPAFPTVARYRTQYRYGSAETGWIDTADVSAPAHEVTVGPIALTSQTVDVRVWAISNLGMPSAPLLIPGALF